MMNLLHGWHKKYVMSIQYVYLFSTFPFKKGQLQFF